MQAIVQGTRTTAQELQAHSGADGKPLAQAGRRPQRTF